MRLHLQRVLPAIVLAAIVLVCAAGCASDTASGGAPDSGTPASDGGPPPDLAGGSDGGGAPDLASTPSGGSVSQHHNDGARTGLYLDPAFTAAAAAGLKRDATFDGSIAGNAYAQPLYVTGGPGGRAVVIAVTESNTVFALDASNGMIAWQLTLGPPVPLAKLPCGDIDPLGITSTPVVDLRTRTLYVAGMTTPDGGTTKKHVVAAIDVDGGALRSGWPVDVSGVTADGKAFPAAYQNQRGALGIVGDKVYVPYGGHYGDCGTYYGFLVGVPLAGGAATAFATAARGGGSWAVGGVATDGAAAYIATGNTFGAQSWSGGEAIVRLQPGPVFSGQPADYWSPTNWQALDAGDVDLGGSGALLVDVPGATPSRLVVSLGKDGNAYLLDRDHLGGVSAPVAQAHVASGVIIQAAATYRTSQGTYVVFRGAGLGCPGGAGDLAAFRITAASPPAIQVAWCATQNGRGSPFVTSPDGRGDFVVWSVGTEGDQRLHGFDGDTGKVVYAGGGSSERLAGTRRFNTGIVAGGRLFFAADNKVYAFKP